MGLKKGVMLVLMAQLLNAADYYQRLPITRKITPETLQDCLDNLQHKSVEPESLVRTGERAVIVGTVLVKRIDQTCFARCDRKGIIQSVFVARNNQSATGLFEEKGVKVLACQEGVFEILSNSTKKGFCEFVRVGDKKR